MYYDDILVSPLKGSRYHVKKEVVFKDITVPINYVTNGADIPRLFWSIIPPNLSDILPAVIVHDYMCDKAIEIKDFEKADEYLNEIMVLLDINMFKRKTVYNAVKLYTKTIRRLKWR